ncbi:MAG: hypothetical protein U0791_11105 [Gemmataceae bacterium]
MNLLIEITPLARELLGKRAALRGESPESLASEMIERAVKPVKSLDELLAPFRQSFEESGATEEELDALVKEAKKEIWEEDRKAKS